MENEVQVVPQCNLPAQSLPERILELAIKQGAPLESLEKYLEMKRADEAYEAKKAYTASMAAFKKNPPKIHKDKHVSFTTSKGTTAYNHATLANVTEKINSALSTHGLHASWRTDQKDKLITVTCTITHELGHSESTSLSASPDESGGKNSIQAIGSSVSYLCRYTLLALTGLATYDQDSDGMGAKEEPKTITTDQSTEIDDLLADVYGDKLAQFKPQWLKWIGSESVDEIPAPKYRTAIDALNAAKAKKEAAKK